MRASLATLLDDAVAGAHAVPSFNVFGYEDARAVVTEAERRGAPVIIATSREVVEFFGLATAADLFGHVATDARVPVCLHLDHCHDVAIACRAVEAGYDSVMYDGSQLPLAENVARTREVVEHAHARGVSVEGEIGSVGYDAGDNRGREHIRFEPTEPASAEAFADGSGVDAVAVSVGNVHRLPTAGARIDVARLHAIAARVARPLVLHGASGIPDAELTALATGTPVAKFNIGTALRQRFARALRETLAAHPREYDRLTIFGQVMPAIGAEAGRFFDLLMPATAPRATRHA